MCAIHRNVAFQLGYFWAADANVIKSSIRQHLWCLLNCIQIKQTSFLIQVNDRNNHKTWLFFIFNHKLNQRLECNNILPDFYQPKGGEFYANSKQNCAFKFFMCVIFGVFSLMHFIVKPILVCEYVLEIQLLGAQTWILERSECTKKTRWVIKRNEKSSYSSA